MGDPSNPIISLVISVIAALGTAFITSIVYWRQAKIDLRKEYESRFNTKRWETYLGMNEIIQGIYYREQSIEDGSISLENKISLLRTQILLIASKNVVDAFGAWQYQRAHFKDYHSNTFEKLHALVIEMRKDLGIQDSQPDLEAIRGYFHSIV